MHNKIPRSSHYHTRRSSNVTPFSLNLTDSDDLVPSLFYSNTQSKMIDLNKIEKIQLTVPLTTPFQPQIDVKKQCKRKDCVDRKFEAIKKLNKSAPNVKIVSPRKVDIVLVDKGDTLEKKREPCIHSTSFFSKKTNPERDLLKEFKQLQEMRKELRSRNYQNSSRASFYLNAGRTDKQTNLHHSSDNRDNPERTDRTALYAQVKARISKRYNSMFKKFSQGMKEEMRAERLFLKDICSARSFRKKPQSE